MLHTDTAVVVLSLIAVITNTLVAAASVEALVSTRVMTVCGRVTLIHVQTGASIAGQRVAEWTRADKHAGCVAALKLTRSRAECVTLIHVHTLALSACQVHLVASVTQTPV